MQAQAILDRYDPGEGTLVTTAIRYLTYYSNCQDSRDEDAWEVAERKEIEEARDKGNRKMGYVYAAFNPSFKEYIKIGATTKTPFQRLRVLSRTSVPTPFALVTFAEVFDPFGLERMIHRHLDSRRKFGRKNEFFEISTSGVVEVFNLPEVKDWNMTSASKTKPEKSGETEAVRTMRKVIAEEFEECVGHRLLFVNILDLFAKSMGVVLKRDVNLFRRHCKRLFLAQWPNAKNDRYRGKRCYLNVKPKQGLALMLLDKLPSHAGIIGTLLQIDVDVPETPPMAIESAIPEGLSSDASPPIELPLVNSPSSGQAERSGHVLNMPRGANGGDIVVKAIKSFFADELEACEGNFMSFNDLEGLFLLYVGPSTPQVKSLFKFYCKTLLIGQFPCAENKNRDNKKGYLNVRRKLAH